MNTTTQFKRLAVGQTFATPQGNFRKASNHGAFALFPPTDPVRPNRGQTHKHVPFSRSAAVQGASTKREGRLTP